ncbi:MAG TPA: hypothetical protein VGA40_08705 [Candidatus Acidoferrales bacterium]
MHERLGPLGLAEVRRREIVCELADHLSDREEDTATSAPHFTALRMVEETDWSALSHNIRRAEGDNMNDRTRHLWLPGMATLTLSMAVLMAFGRMGLDPRFIWVDPRTPLLFYVPWLLLLPVLGALGTYWSKRAGAALRMRLLAGVLPAAGMLAVFLLVLPVALLVDMPRVGWLVVQSFAISVLNWVLIPGAFLLLGALPFVRNGDRAVKSS